MGTKLTEPLIVLFDKDTDAWLRERAGRDERSISYVIRDAVRRYRANIETKGEKG